MESTANGGGQPKNVVDLCMITSMCNEITASAIVSAVPRRGAGKPALSMRRKKKEASSKLGDSVLSSEPA